MHDSIYTDNGIKLVEKGTRVDSGLYQGLIQHKLNGRIDDHLAVDGMVSVSALAELAQQMCASDLLLQLLTESAAGLPAGPLVAVVQKLELPNPLAFKLTVMREQHASLFAHSVRMMLVSVFIGLKRLWSPEDCAHLAAAALLHDLGVLHMNPAWHDPHNKIDGAERKHLQVHPVTAMILLREQKIYPQQVLQAVLEHHECLDGSGYPRGAQAGQISPMGQVLMVAEIATAFFDKYSQQNPALRLSLTLKLNHRKYPAALAQYLLPLLQQPAQAGAAAVTLEEVQRLLDLQSCMFDDWQAYAGKLPPSALVPSSEQASAFVALRLAALQKTLYEAGCHPDLLKETLAMLDGDAQTLSELGWLAREALWQLQNLLDVMHSRWPDLAESHSVSDQAVLQWAQACADLLAPYHPHGGD